MALTPDENRRYARHIVLKGIGGTGQQRLKAARVLVVGVGGLGSPVIAYLAGAGVGTIGVVDDDAVSLSNLQRQIIHTTSGIGQPKVDSAAQFAHALNPNVKIQTHPLRLDAKNGAALMADYDVILDGTDRFESRADIARSAELSQKTLISGGVSMFDGQLTVFAPHLSDEDGNLNPRFGDLYPDMPDAPNLPTCEEVGILGATTGVIGTLMAMEAIKLITKVGAPLLGRLLLYDGRNARFSEVRYTRRS